MSTPTLAFDLDLPVLEDEGVGSRHVTREVRREAAEQSWIARNDFGFSILHYDDVVAMLRDKRWHSATSKIMELSGITDPEYLARRRTSILRPRARSTRGCAGWSGERSPRALPTGCGRSCARSSAG